VPPRFVVAAGRDCGGTTRAHAVGGQGQGVLWPVGPRCGDRRCSGRAGPGHGEGGENSDEDAGRPFFGWWTAAAAATARPRSRRPGSSSSSSGVKKTSTSCPLLPRNELMGTPRDGQALTPPLGRSRNNKLRCVALRMIWPRGAAAALSVIPERTRCASNVPLLRRILSACVRDLTDLLFLPRLLSPTASSPREIPSRDSAGVVPMGTLLTPGRTVSRYVPVRRRIPSTRKRLCHFERVGKGRAPGTGRKYVHQPLDAPNPLSRFLNGT
jgi:hypothetical protein